MRIKTLFLKGFTAYNTNLFIGFIEHNTVVALGSKYVLAQPSIMVYQGVWKVWNTPQFKGGSGF